MKFLALLALLTVAAKDCSNKDQKSSGQQNGPDKTVVALYDKYKFGQIEECTFEGKKVYHAGINAYDVGTQVYDQNGKSIGICNYMARKVDSICEKLQNCEVVWRCEKHISGGPAVDKYGLAKTSEQGQQK